jgi:capsular polysaccharide biosynthesis protein
MTKEKELEGKLQKCGVEVIRAETLPFDEQVRRFREADLVVGPHGAGLSNIVWTRDAELLEIFPCSWFNDCYARITRSLGFEYNYLRGRRDGTTYGKMPISQILDFVGDWGKGENS